MELCLIIGCFFLFVCLRYYCTFTLVLCLLVVIISLKYSGSVFTEGEKSDTTTRYFRDRKISTLQNCGLSFTYLLRIVAM